VHRKIGQTVFFVIALAASPTAALAQRPSEVACCIRSTRCHTTFVVSHRARGFDAPEQSRQAVRRAIKAGVPAIEVDLRRSLDGELFVLHDETLDRTTCHKGRIAGVRSTDVAAARLKNGEFLPRFVDLYALTRGSAVLDLHLKVDAVEQVAEWLDRHGSFDDVIFFVDTGPMLETAARLRRRFPAMLVMPRMRSDAELDLITRALGGLPPIVHQDFPTREEVWRWHQRGVKVFAKATDFERLPPPLPLLGWQTLLATGVDFVLSDDARPLVSRDRHRRALGGCAVSR
jgi:glycerophosphoryl diester phosphodiesterase